MLMCVLRHVVGVAVVGGECTDYVPDFPLIVRCRWRLSGRNADDVHGYIVTVESERRDTCPPLDQVMTLALNYLHKCRSDATSLSSYQRLGGLRAFVHADCFSAADLLQG